MNDSLPKQKKLIPVSEAAKVLGVSIDTVRRWDKSGVLHSERPDGKNRYFSLDELEKHKIHQPLPISEVARKLSISATTLRRLETRGLFKPNRNRAGERVYDKDSIENFLNSDYFRRKNHDNDYFLRKKQIKEKILEPFREENEPLEDITVENGTQHLERRDLENDVKNILPEIPAKSSGEIKAEPIKKITLAPNLKFFQRIPEFLSAAVIFLLLIAIGVTNITVSAVKSSNPSPTPSVLSITKTENPNPSPTPAVLSVTVTNNPAAPSQTPKILTIKINDGAETVNIRQKPTSYSEKIGKAEDGDTFEFISLDAGWYEVKLADGSTGFISAKYAVEGGANN